MNGSTAFLVCGGPSAASPDVRQLETVRGSLLAAINLAGAALVRPHLWFCGDQPSRFPLSIWKDPAVLKHVRDVHLEAPLSRRFANGVLAQAYGQTPRGCPSVASYSVQTKGVDPETFFEAGPVQWGDVDRRSTLLVALRLLYGHGVRTLFLVGCDFTMTRKPYAFDVVPSAKSIIGNEDLFPWLDETLHALRPAAERNGLKVFNCTPGGNLTAFNRVDLSDAVAYVREACPVETDFQEYYHASS